jgi:ribosomal protein S18 acetylase RimI-like enzyme
MLETHITNNDIALDRSIVAQAADGAFVGIALLGVRGGRGWVGGVGVSLVWRGKGAGALLMRSLIARARALGLRTLQLEVLEPNTVARHLYERLGFVTTRRLDIFTGQLTNMPATVARELAIIHVPVADALAAYSALRPAALPWQRDPATLAHLAERGAAIQALALMRDASIHAALLYTSANDSLLTLFGLGSYGVTSDERRDHGLALLTHLVKDQPSGAIRAVNIPPDDPLDDLLRALGCPVVMSQQEMLLDLS